MGLFQKAAETYDANLAFVGKEQADLRPLPPISHAVKNASIEITLNERGEIQDASMVDKERSATIIPVTESSAGRSGKIPSAHPLCDQVQYLSGENEVRFELYTLQLKKWADSEFSHPMLNPILTYVNRREILDDLRRFGIEVKDGKQLVRWRVNGIGEESGLCWKNERLFQAFCNWYRSVRSEMEGNNALCMVSGEMTLPALQHLKGVVPSSGNAKLISTNDTENFTYRGRFLNDSQALSISYDVSQKAHNALQWLIVNQGKQVAGPNSKQIASEREGTGETESKTTLGGRTFLCWNPKGKRVPHCEWPFAPHETIAVTPTDYKEELRKTLDGWRVQLPENCGGVSIASFDAATNGRLAVTYYNDLMASDFLQRLYDWDESCCWWDFNPTSGRFDAIRSPSLWTIIKCAYGTVRNDKNGKVHWEVDERIAHQQMRRLVMCRVDRMAFPADVMRVLVRRGCTPQAFEKNAYELILRTTCAAVKKYYHDCKKEELSMTIDEGRQDRSYQFGRLLAVLDRAEEDFYQSKENEHRQTNAMKYMAKFQQRPYAVYMHIHQVVNDAYIPRIAPPFQQRFRKRNEEINEWLLNHCSQQELNMPLKETFLMGFYNQRRAFFQSKNETEQEEN